MPLSLSDEDLALLNQLAAPVGFGQRDQFLRQVADALAAYPEPGPGVVYRVARDIQRGFTLTAQREAGLANPPNPQSRAMARA
jgi:hypothetical protein